MLVELVGYEDNETRNCEAFSFAVVHLLYSVPNLFRSCKSTSKEVSSY